MSCVYILTNPAIPGLIKIGFTSDQAHERAKTLSGTSAPVPFDVAWSIETLTTDLAREVEQEVHAFLAATRYNPAREFFKLSVAEAIDHIERIAFEKSAVSSNLECVARFIEAERIQKEEELARQKAEAARKALQEKEEQRRAAEAARAEAARNALQEKEKQRRAAEAARIAQVQKERDAHEEGKKITAVMLDLAKRILDFIDIKMIDYDRKSFFGKEPRSSFERNVFFSIGELINASPYKIVADKLAAKPDEPLALYRTKLSHHIANQYKFHELLR